MSTRESAPKSMPCPGMTVMPDSRSANLSSPRARAASMACCWVMPAGSCPPMTPAKMRFVACPRIFGPMTLNDTLPSVRRSTANAGILSGPSRRSSRLAEGQKSIDFSTGMPAVTMAPGPRIGLGGGRGGACGVVIRGPRVNVSAASVFVGRNSCDRFRGELGLDDLGVRGAAGEQLVMGAEAHHGAVVDDQDLVGVDDGRHPL